VSLFQFLGALEIGLIYGLVAIGVYLSFRVLDFPDLTADGSFPMGAAIAGALILSGTEPVLATLVAMAGGAAAGLVTAYLNVRWNILHLLASILTMTALYSINIRIMGRPNISLLGDKTIFTPLETLFPDQRVILYVSIFLIVVIIYLLYKFLISQIGLALRATGKNKQMATAQGINTNYMTYLGIALSNALIALAGAFWTQSQSFADVTLGPGTIIIGLAAVMIGEALVHTRRIWLALVSCLLGSIIYRLVIALALNSDTLGLETSDLRFVEAVIVGLAMILPRIKSPIQSLFKKKSDKRKEMTT
jgi:putative ABC transport system permease protein